MTDNAKLAEYLEAHRYNMSAIYAAWIGNADTIIAALRKNAAGQVCKTCGGAVSKWGDYITQCHTCAENYRRGITPDPAAPTLAELDKVAWTTGYMASRFREALVNAYRSGKLREVPEGCMVVSKEIFNALTNRAQVGDGEVVVPDGANEIIPIAGQSVQVIFESVEKRNAYWNAAKSLLAAKDAS